MTAEEALQILLATLPRAFAIARQSLTQLGLPNALLAVPPDLPSYLDYDLRLRCEHAQGGEVVCRLLPEPWGFWFHGEMGDSVCYAFGSRIPAALHIQLRKLHEEAEDAGMAPEQLLSILLLHEAVHVLMMSGFIGDRDYDAWRWLQELRSIHETMALKVCTLSGDQFARREDVDRYVALVRARADGTPYESFFIRFENLPADEDFWRHVHAHSPDVVLPALRAA